MKRAYVYRNIFEDDGKLMAFGDNMETFKTEVSSIFKLPKENIKLYTKNCCEINDLRLIRDDEKIYLSLEKKGDHKTCDNIEKSLENLTVQEKRQSLIVSEWITLNVGGKHFTTSHSTLQAKEPMSMLARMFADDNNGYLMNPSARDSSGAYLIDRSPEYFAPILNYLRHGDVVLDKNVNPKGVLAEAVFYGMFFLCIFYLPSISEKTYNQICCLSPLVSYYTIKIRIGLGQHYFLLLSLSLLYNFK